MANMKKYTMAACGHMYAHYEREKDENDEYVKFKNQDIDPERTPLNYNLATHQTMSQGEFMRKRCSEVTMQKRKDVNVMVSWIVTAPKDLKEDEYEKFFKSSYEFLEKRYGKENVVSAYVHMDETTPHMHFAFVPVVKSFSKRKNQEIEKVSAKECVDRNDLQRFHGELEQYLGQELGHEVHIMNEATKEGNKSIEELKRKSAADRLKEVQVQVDEKKGELEEVERKIGVAESIDIKKIKDKSKPGMLDKSKVVIDVDMYNSLMKYAELGKALYEEKKRGNASWEKAMEESKKIKEDALSEAKNIKENALSEAKSIKDDAKQESLDIMLKRTKNEIELKEKVQRYERVLNSSKELLSSFLTQEKRLDNFDKKPRENLEI